MIIRLPQRFDRDTLGPFFAELDLSREVPIVHVDFSTLAYSYPTAMLVAGSKLREWIQYRSQRGYESIRQGIDPGRTVHSYLMHLGFFDFIYMDDGNRVGQARGSSRYLPITRITISPFNPYEVTLAEWHNDIVQQSRRLGSVLSGSFEDSEELRVYSYSIREIIRNVFEHSGAAECFICGQRWYDGKAEIAIIDEGFGVYRTISTAHQVADDFEALNFALMPGVSRVNGLPDDQNIYDNSGFGLYVLSNLSASFGWFAIGSGSARIIGYNNTERLAENFSFAGTFFGMRLTSQPRNFLGVLNDIITVGEEESGTMGVRRRASGISRIAD